MLQETARNAFFVACTLLRDDGSPKSLHELDDNTATAISGVDVLEDYKTRGNGPDGDSMKAEHRGLVEVWPCSVTHALRPASSANLLILYALMQHI